MSSGTDRREWKQPLYLLLFVLGAWLLIELKAIVVALIIALTLASAISPVAEWLEEKWRIPRPLTVVGIYLLVGLFYTFVAVAVLPALHEQAINLYRKLPDYVEGVLHLYAKMKTTMGESASALTIQPSDIQAFAKGLTKRALNFTSDLLSSLVAAILVLFLTAYFVIEAKSIWEKLLEWVPTTKRARMSALIRPLEGRLGGYVRGQLLVSLAVATFLGIGLSILRVDHALILAVLSGLLNLVPFVGSLTTAVLAVTVAVNKSLALGALTVGLFALEQWVESNFIVPHLLGSQVELHPLLVLFSILIGATLLGLPGALIAVPVTTAGMFIAEEFYLRKLQQEEREKGAESEPEGVSNQKPEQSDSI